MATDDPIAELIPWYANGTIDLDGKARVEAHLNGCPDCRARLDAVRALEGLRSEGETTLLDHVHAQHLDSFVRDPRALPEELSGWIRGHLAECPACSGALGALERTARVEAASEAVPPAGLVDGARRFFERTALRPAAAVAYLAALAVLGTLLYRGQAERAADATRTARLDAWGGAVDLTVISDVVRSSGRAPRIEVDGAQPVVPLGAEFELPEDLDATATIRVEIRDAEDRVVWSEDVPAGRVAENLRRAGLLTLLVPSSALPPGPHRLTVLRLDRTARPLLDAPFEMARM